MAAAARTVHCYGASITEGLTVTSGGSQDFVPFSGMLADVSKGRLVGANYGVCGELSEEVCARFHHDVETNTTKLATGDFVVFLCGSNDLGHGMPVETPAKNVTKMATLAASKGAIPVTCTLPPLGRGYPAPMYLRMGGANDALRAVTAAAAPPPAPSSTTWLTLDVDPVLRVPAPADTGDTGVAMMRDEYCADGLHLTPAGYAKIAEALTALLLAHVDVPSAAPASAASP